MAVNKYIDTVTIMRAALGDLSRPRYRAIAASLLQAIQEGQIRYGAKLPPLRVLADELSVTVGTINRAYSEIERLGLLTSRVGDGTYVTRPGERSPDPEFENAPPDDGAAIDLSRNTNIQGQELALLADALARLSGDRRRLAKLSQYAPDAGLWWHREAGAQWLRLSGVDAQPDRVVATNGAQHALLSTMTAMLRPDDLVVSEHLSYPGLTAAARMLGIRLIGLPIDEEGLIPEALRDICEQQKVQALYCTPTIQNPTTAVMGSERRQAIAELCLKYNVRIIEDDAHGVMADRHPPSLAEFAPAHCATIGSVAKAVSAGLRVGFVAAPKQWVGRIASAVRTSCWMATPLTTEIAANWILDGTAVRLRDEQLKEIRRRKALVSPLLSGLGFRSHDNSCHFWIVLPEPWRATELVAELEQRRVLIKAAEAFAVGHIGVPQCIRASLSGVASDESLVAGFRILADTVSEGSFRLAD